MKKEYKEIKFSFDDIDSAVKKLKRSEGLVCGMFNGQMLYSDIDDLDSAYKKITGKTKSEFDKAIRKRQEEYEQRKKEHKSKIPELTKSWIQKGKIVLDEKYHKLWIEMVPIRLNDLYQGFELGACLEIVEKLNNDCELRSVKSIIEKQGHSGMSFSLVCSMIEALCDRGGEFVKYTKV